MISSIPRWMGNLFESSMRPNVKVAETTYIRPAIKRISFHGDISKWNFQIGYASVVRVSETEFRNYTVVRHDKENDSFEMIVHIHGNGVGSQFMDNVKAGDELFVSPPRGKKMYHPGVKPQVFFGDETSLGMACALWPLLQETHHPFQLYLELDEENKHVPELLGWDNCMVFPKEDSFRNEAWIDALPLFSETGWTTANCMLVGNVTSVQTFRKVLKKRVQGNIHSQGYWLEGKKGL